MRVHAPANRRAELGDPGRSAGAPAATSAASGSGRTLWDVMSEAVTGGWDSTARLAVLLLVRAGLPCGAGVLVIRLAWVLIRR
jgi:hypothetical protein